MGSSWVSCRAGPWARPWELEEPALSPALASLRDNKSHCPWEGLEARELWGPGGDGSS